MTSSNAAPGHAAPVITRIGFGEWEKCEEPGLPEDETISYCAAMLRMGTENGPSGKYNYPRLGAVNHALHAGLAFLRKGQADFARKYFEFSIMAVTEEINKFPEPGLYGQRCWIRAVLNAQLDRAMADCEQALQGKPDDPELLRNKGFVLFRLGKYQEALVLYDASLQAKQDDAYGLFLRGALKQKLGDTTAEADIKAATALNFKIVAIFKNYSVSLN
jgi:tetratricopeptide (TPR) repeat protein